jgi:2-dehydropantoate 2-reductase
VRTCIVGAGSIGSLFAGHLATVTDVVVLTRRAEHARALNEHGLRVSGRHDFTVRVRAASDPRDVSDFDLGVIATKANGVEAAAESLGGRFAGATMMTVQNGLGAEEIMRAHGDWPLVSAVTFMSGTKHSDTHVEYILDTPTWLGPYGDTPFERVQEIAQLLVDSGLKAEALPDLLPAQWSKLIFNATVNGVAAELHDDPWEMNVLATKRGSAHYPSMLEDVDARRPTEVELINGALVREAVRCGVEAPLQTAVYRLVKAREASYL